MLDEEIKTADRKQRQANKSSLSEEQKTSLSKIRERLLAIGPLLTLPVIEQKQLAPYTATYLRHIIGEALDAKLFGTKMGGREWHTTIAAIDYYTANKHHSLKKKL